MQISTQLLEAWKERRTRGDIRRLVVYTQASKPTIIRAIKHGQANEEIILKISRFYSEKISAEDIQSQALNLLSNAKTEENN